MSRTRQAGKAVRRSPMRLAVVAVGAVTLLGAGVPAAFAPCAPKATKPAQQDTASRRSLLAAVVAAAATANFGAVHAAGAPDQLQVTGAFGKRGPQVNGFWSIVPGEKVNDRAVYKKDGQNIWLMYNDCGQFQMAEKITNGCDGFALESGGKWRMEGKDSKMSLKPVKKEVQEQPAEGEEAPAPPKFKLPSVFGFGDKDKDGAAEEKKPAPKSSSGGPSLGIQLPTLGLTGKESTMELLEKGQDVGTYVKTQQAQGFSETGGNGNYENAVMRLDKQEAKIADSLEARLERKTGSRFTGLGR